MQCELASVRLYSKRKFFFELLGSNLEFKQIPLFYPRGCAAPLRGIAAIATLERFCCLLLVSSSELIIRPRPRARPRGHGELLKLLREPTSAKSQQYILPTLQKSYPCTFQNNLPIPTYTGISRDKSQAGFQYVFLRYPLPMTDIPGYPWSAPPCRPLNRTSSTAIWGNCPKMVKSGMKTKAVKLREFKCSHVRDLSCHLQSRSEVWTDPVG